MPSARPWLRPGSSPAAAAALRPGQLLARFGTLLALLAADRSSTSPSRPISPRSQTLNVNLTQVAPIVIVGVGMTLVIATGGIDLSVGSLMAIAGALAPLIFCGSLFPIPTSAIGIALAFVAAGAASPALFGCFNGWLITRFRIQPIVAHAGPVHRRARHRPGDRPTATCRSSTARVPVHRPRPRRRRPGPGHPDAGDRRGRRLGRCARPCSAAQILAVGGNETAARLAGIPVERVKRLRLHASAACCAGVAGPDRHRPQLGLGRQSRRPRHGARRHRRRRRRRHAADRRPGHHPRHAGRRAHHPARPLHAARQRRAGCGGAGRQGGAHRARRSGCSGRRAETP